MMDKGERTPRISSSTPAEIYTSVGVALSWWEASEDILMGIFRWLCAEIEPIAFDTYVASSRSTRAKMLQLALSHYKTLFLPEEVETIRASMKALDKLAPMRNQIAHGHVSEAHRTTDGVVTMSGNFLVPSLNEQGQYIVRDFRYAHTASEIDEWRDEVRAKRGLIMDAHHAAMIRQQEARMRTA